MPDQSVICSVLAIVLRSLRVAAPRKSLTLSDLEGVT